MDLEWLRLKNERTVPPLLLLVVILAPLSFPLPDGSIDVRDGGTTCS